jgi:serine palmitoyltransferase
MIPANIFLSGMFQNDLRRVLQEVAATDKKLGRKSNDQRRFIVVEGLYKNSGTIVPLDELVAMKHEFKYRLILDESFSFGTLGKTGKGVIELYQKRHMYDAEIVTISLENALGGVGGVSVGNEEVVDHQRLSGAGYCFSASSPPFTASAATCALNELQSRPKLIHRLTHNTGYMQKKLKVEMQKVIPDILTITSDRRSPIIFLQLAGAQQSFDFDEQVRLLDLIAEKCLSAGVAVVSTGHHVGGDLQTHPPPAIRLTVLACHTDSDMDEVLATLKNAALNVLKK